MNKWNELVEKSGRKLDKDTLIATSTDLLTKEVETDGDIAYEQYDSGFSLVNLDIKNWKDVNRDKLEQGYGVYHFENLLPLDRLSIEIIDKLRHRGMLSELPDDIAEVMDHVADYVFLHNYISIEEIAELGLTNEEILLNNTSECIVTDKKLLEYQRTNKLSLYDFLMNVKLGEIPMSPRETACFVRLIDEDRNYQSDIVFQEIQKSDYLKSVEENNRCSAGRDIGGEIDMNDDSPTYYHESLDAIPSSVRALYTEYIREHKEYVYYGRMDIKRMTLVTGRGMRKQLYKPIKGTTGEQKEINSAYNKKVSAFNGELIKRMMYLIKRVPVVEQRENGSFSLDLWGKDQDIVGESLYSRNFRYLRSLQSNSCKYKQDVLGITIKKIPKITKQNNKYKDPFLVYTIGRSWFEDLYSIIFDENLHLSIMGLQFCIYKNQFHYINKDRK